MTSDNIMSTQQHARHMIEVFMNKLRDRDLPKHLKWRHHKWLGKQYEDGF